VLRPLVESGQIGGRTVQINDRGEVECVTYPVAPLGRDAVRIRTIASAISPGTEMTFFGRAATNVYLHKYWDERLRLFVRDAPTLEYPVVFGYRAVGEVVEGQDRDLPPGTRVFGNWRHTEFTASPPEQARRQRLADGLSIDDGVDIAQMGPICVNGVAFAEGEHVDAPAVVFGAGPVGLITAQVARATGAARVYVVDRLANRLAVAEGMGLTPLDASRPGDLVATLKTELGSEAVRVAFECTGSTVALHEAIRVVRRRGVVVAMGFYQGEAQGLFLGEEFHHNGVQVRSGQIGNVHPAWTWDTLRARTVELALSGEVVLGGLPRRVLPVERVAEGFEALRRPDEVVQVQLSYDGAQV
jgi:threonine dehydrogenase-like Zn-dependent dehydrogenase